MATHTAMAQGSDASMRSSLEQHLGILHFVSSKEHGWSGQSRTRYTDFLVHEITKDGEVVHLSNFHSNARELAQATRQITTAPPSTHQLSQPNEPESLEAEGNTSGNNQELSTVEMTGTQGGEPPKDGIPDSDQTILVDLVGQTCAGELIAFYVKVQQNPKAPHKTQGEVTIPAIKDKSQRSRVHGEIRRIFGGKIETTTGSDDNIRATAARGGNKQRGNRSTNNGIRSSRQNPAQNGDGPYLHFSLYKENKDTMDALNHMAKTLRLHPKVFGAAGTKDRRAVTVQRVSIKSRNPSSLVSVNERINNIKIGDFKYAQHPIRLNDHDGNEFVIVLKNCSFSGTGHLSFQEKLSVANSIIDSALAQVVQHGFINYYGTQRFGTHQIGTQEVGMKILQEDFVGATQALLSYDPLLLQDPVQGKDHTGGANRESVDRARACAAFLNSKDSKAALNHLPPRCHVEKTLIQHLGKNPTDFIGALMSINRSMRTMYVHAYQSFVWNFLASKRWEQFGAQVVKGDLVLVEAESALAQNANDGEMATEGGFLLDEDIAATKDYGLVAHALTEDEAKGGKYSIYDVVLPSPGWDVLYPLNEIGEFYTEFMGKPENGGLDPQNMRRRQRDFSLPGSYRKLMGKLKRIPTAVVQAYSSDLEQLVPTDLDIIRSRKAKEATERAARQQNAASSWHKFTQNVQQNELEESRERIARREAEELPPPVRMNDTWVQTSMDGSNKRIKIAKHTTVGTDEDQSVPQADGDSIQNKNSPQYGGTIEVNANTVAVDQRNGGDGMKGHQAYGSFSSPILTAIVAQVRAITNSFIHAIHQVMVFLRITTDRNSVKPNRHDPQLESLIRPPQSTSTDSEEMTQTGAVQRASETAPTSNTIQPDVHPNPDVVSVALQPSDAPNNPQSNAASIPRTSDTALDGFAPAKCETTLPADPTSPQKIAVILRFALDTSQYATMVIRELQGAPFRNHDVAQALNEPTLSERAANSA
ncbi:pseudouridine synthase [Xylariaceae sp. FL1651]|nr:pseudouridine synthase [Xylariaceae sp. FL1651]